MNDIELLNYHEKMEKCILSLLNLSLSESQTEDDILQIIINEVTDLTSSECGYLHLFNQDNNTIELKFWSDSTLRLCKVVYDNHYPLASAGIWADCVRLKQPVIHNDYETYEHKKGLPDGHFPIKRHMSIPVFEEDKIVMIIGVGNKIEPYDDLDTKQMEIISKYLWNIIKNKKIKLKLIEKNEELRYDFLTKVYSRREFESSLEKILSNDHQNVLAFFDLDNFKFINDIGSHSLGDEMLKEFTYILIDCIHPKDIIGRLGGDEFGIIFPDSTIEDVIKICNNILLKLNNKIVQIGKQNFNLKSSIGLTAFDKTFTKKDVLSFADSACFLAKELGKNQIQIFKETNHNFLRFKENQSITNRIYTITETDDLVLFVQPIKCFQKNCHNCNLNKSMTQDIKMKCKKRIFGFEVLLRIRENEQLISPVKYIETAEKYNLSKKIDEYVIDKALSKFLEIFLKFNTKFMLFINISGNTISDKDFLSFLIKKLSFFPFKENICFEITETSTIDNFDNTLLLINTIREMGVKIALDDFGVGLSSFSYLKNLPVDFIKIDGLFIQDIMSNKFSEIITKSIINVANSIGIYTIGEFVETKEIVEFLKPLGINFMQGYFFSKPFPLENLLNSNT